VAIAQVVGW